MSKVTKNEIMDRIRSQRETAPPLTEKDKLRKEIERQTSEFIKNGGKIQKLEIRPWDPETDRNFVIKNQNTFSKARQKKEAARKWNNSTDPAPDTISSHQSLGTTSLGQGHGAPLLPESCAAVSNPESGKSAPTTGHP
jgi:hypothetical protein